MQKQTIAWYSVDKTEC